MQRLNFKNTYYKLNPGKRKCFSTKRRRRQGLHLRNIVINIKLPQHRWKDKNDGVNFAKVNFSLFSPDALAHILLATKMASEAGFNADYLNFVN